LQKEGGRGGVKVKFKCLMGFFRNINDKIGRSNGKVYPSTSSVCPTDSICGLLGNADRFG